MLGSKPLSTPSDYATKLHQQSRTPLSLEDVSSFRRLIGRLIYLTNTRPNITYAMQHLSQLVVAPTSAHQQAVVRILRYIKGSPRAGIFLFATTKFHLKGFSDSGWAGCINTIRSITGYAMMYISDSLISWKSKKQATVSRSSLEVEYKALAHAICDLQWLTYLLEEFKVDFQKPATLYCDNKSSLHIVTKCFMKEQSILRLTAT
ncbi:uncharacterized protein LOC114401833 [Glycine soja]|uniref:uncharacterized protein LOC114401833 n=1 Tax=Glycine soja TaxID=3848 RepID=UPI00103C7162|nr:uncharacterized protein LOC114401833 [Glycine soja]